MGFGLEKRASALHRNVSFFVAWEEPTLFKLVSDCLHLHFADWRTVEAWAIYNAIGEPVIGVQELGAGDLYRRFFPDPPSPGFLPPPRRANCRWAT